jgi:multiple sugar transport system substrate-binding protein
LVLAVSLNVSDRPAYYSLVDRYEKKFPNVDVELMEISGDIYQKLLVMIAAGNAPDLMWMGQSFQEFANRGVFLDVTDRVARDLDIKNFTPKAVEWYQFKGRNYGIAQGLDMRFITYNKDLFDKAGLPYPKNGWTYDEFLAAAQKLTIDENGDGKPEQWGFFGDLDHSLFKAEMISEKGGGALCNSPEMLDFLHTNLDLAEKYRVSPSGRQTVNEAFDNLVSIFRQGKVGMMSMATWNMADMQTRCANMRWDIVANPTVRQPGHWASCQAFVISATTKHPEESWQLCKMFLEEDYQKTKYPTILPSNIAVQQALQSEAGGKPPDITAMMVASESLYRMPRVANLSELIQFWQDAVVSVWTKRSTPEEAMALAERQINRAIEMQRENAP